MSEEFEDEWYVVCVYEELGEVFELQYVFGNVSQIYRRLIW